jgi:Tfp pilus assembly protein PilF
MDYAKQELAQMTFRGPAFAIVITLCAASAGYGQAASETEVAAKIRTLRDAVAANPNAPLLQQLSQAYAMANQPEAALSAIEGALALQPDNPEYLRARAILATWAAHYDRARDSYRHLARVQPLEPDVTLNYARVSAWAGDTDNAVGEYRKYLAGRPDAADVWLELARTESWRGNYASALNVLSTYRERFGESAAYLSELAGVMASGGRPARAQDVLTPLLAAAPDSYELNLTRTVALARQHRTREAFDSLDTLRTLATDPIGIRTAERVLRAELASSAEPRVTAYSDSDRLQVQRFAPAVTLALPSGTRISGGYERIRLESAIGSGLEQLDGASTAYVEQMNAGLQQKIGRVSLGGQLGQATVEGQRSTTYGVGVQVRALDTLFLAAERTEGLFIVSPRTVGLGITQVSDRLQADWTLGMRYHVAMEATYQQLSDGNERLEWTVSPRRSIARRARFNLDMGVSAYRLETTHDLNNGYYDPRRYEYYAITALPYFKLHENVGLGLTLSGGGQRDTTSPAFHFGGTISGEATFGIYAPWLLKVNSSATMNQRLDSGAFRGFGGGVSLVRRF